MLTDLHVRDDHLRELLGAEAKDIEELLYGAYPMPSDEEAVALLRESGKLEWRLLEMALRARGFGNHYRRPNPYLVGVAIIGLLDVPHGHNPWRILFSANTKPHPKHVKQCGEWWLMEAALRQNGHPKLRRVIGFYIVGEPRSDDISGVVGPTLTPCKICRDRMWALSLHPPEVAHDKWVPRILPETLVISADYRHLGIRKNQKAADLHPFHKEPRAFFAHPSDE